MGKSQRTKGAVGEREVADIFSNALGRKFARNIGQARDGGNDLDIGPLCVEIKRRKTLGTIYSWLQQCIVSVPAFLQKNKREHAYPVVVAREDNGEWLVVLRLTDFLALTRDELHAHLAEQPPAELALLPPCGSKYTMFDGGVLHCMAGTVAHTGRHHAVRNEGRLSWD